MITFVTTNKAKIEEAQLVFPDIQSIDLALPEIQSLNINEILEHKLRAAAEKIKPPILVDDTSFFLDCLSGDDGVYGLPGPFIKWFLSTITSIGIVEIAERYNDFGATAVSALGYLDANGHTIYTQGIMRGRVGKAYPGADVRLWSSIFYPDGHEKPFSELDSDIKRAIGQRPQALRQLQYELQVLHHDR